MEIRIHLTRPWQTLGIVVALALFWSGILSVNLSGATQTADASGGQKPAQIIAQATQDIDRQRVKQAVLSNKEGILRYQLETLEHEMELDASPEVMQELNDTRQVLLAIIKARGQSEKLLTESLQELWDAQGSSYSYAHLDAGTTLNWPVKPALGISAHFEDAGYVERFGVPHHALDIPVSQGTTIRAPRDGTVLKVSMNGLGYSYITLDHGDGMQTIYGHITTALMQEGDAVQEGQPIALSGGTPGTQGAGLLTTGAHLHFAVRVKGVLVDPEKYLPELP